MQRLKILALLLCIHILAACSKESSTEVYPTNEDISIKDVSYGKDTKQRLDIFLPAGRDKNRSKFVVLIHGGGWIGGDKNDFGLQEDALKILKEQFPGFALFNLNYRLAEGSKNQYPAAEQDIKAAINYIHQHLNSYQISPQFYVLGGSAGAHLAALYTVKNNHSSLLGCIAISGAYNLTSTYSSSQEPTKEVLRAFMGGTPAEKQNEYFQASPTNFIKNNTPAFLILHGTGDDLVPVSQAQELKQALEEKGVKATSFIYSGGHGIPPEHLIEAFDYFKNFIK